MNDVIVANEQSMTIHLACKHVHTEIRQCQALAPYVEQYNRETGTFCKDCYKKVFELKLRVIGKYYWLTTEELIFIKTAVSSALSTIKTPFDYLRWYL